MNGEETEGLNTMPLDLSTLANLGRTASYGVRRYAQAREENSERELAKDLMRASVTADYGDIMNKLNKGYYRNARPELLSRTSQEIGRGLRLKREEEYTKLRDAETDIATLVATMTGPEYDLLTPEQKYQRAERRVMSRPVYRGLDSSITAAGGATPGGVAPGRSAITGRQGIQQAIARIAELPDREERVEKSRELMTQLRQLEQSGVISTAEYNNQIALVEDAVDQGLAWGRRIQSLGTGALGGVAGAGTAKGIASLLGKAPVPLPIKIPAALAGSYLASEGLPDLNLEYLSNVKRGILGQGPR